MNNIVRLFLVIVFFFIIKVNISQTHRYSIGNQYISISTPKGFVRGSTNSPDLFSFVKENEGGNMLTLELFIDKKYANDNSPDDFIPFYIKASVIPTSCSLSQFQNEKKTIIKAFSTNLKNQTAIYERAEKIHQEFFQDNVDFLPIDEGKIIRNDSEVISLIFNSSVKEGRRIIKQTFIVSGIYMENHIFLIFVVKNDIKNYSKYIKFSNDFVDSVMKANQ